MNDKLLEAVHREDFFEVQSLLSKGASVTHENWAGRTALHEAIITQNEDIVRLLLMNGASVNHADRTGRTVLQDVALCGSEDILELLLKAGASVNHADRSGRTVLHDAAFNGREGIVKLLIISHGASINHEDNDGHTALHRAASRGHEATVRFLVEKGAFVNHVDEKSSTALHEAAARGHETIARFLVEEGASINHQNTYGDTALHRAASCGHESIVRFLLKEGASIDHPDNDGYTPLHQAASHGHEAVVELLLEKGASINHQDRSGHTALHHAAYQEDSVRHEDQYRYYVPSYQPVSHGHEAVVKLLLKKGVAINHKGNYGDTALHNAARRGACAILTLLLEQGALIRKDKSGHTPLHGGVLNKRTDAVKLLLRHGVYAYHDGPDEIFNKYWKELVNTDESQLSLCVHLILGGVNIPKEVDLPEWLAKPKGLIDKTISELLAPFNLSQAKYDSVISLTLQMLPRLLKWVEATHKARKLPDDVEVTRKKLPPRDMDALHDLLSAVKVNEPLQRAHNRPSTAMLQALGNVLPTELALSIQDISIADTLVTGLDKCYPNIPLHVAGYLVDAMMTDQMLPPPERQYPNFYKTLFTHHWETPLEAPITRNLGLRP